MERCDRDLFTEPEGLLFGILCRKVTVVVRIFYLRMRKERLDFLLKICDWRVNGINTCNKEEDNRC